MEVSEFIPGEREKGIAEVGLFPHSGNPVVLGHFVMLKPTLATEFVRLPL